MASPYVWDPAGSIVPQSRRQIHRGVFPWRRNVRPVHGERPIREYYHSHRATGGAVPLQRLSSASPVERAENPEGCAVP